MGAPTGRGTAAPFGKIPTTSVRHLQSPVPVHDDRADAAQSAISRSARELVPEHLGLAGSGGEARDLSTPVRIDPSPGR